MARTVQGVCAAVVLAAFLAGAAAAQPCVWGTGVVNRLLEVTCGPAEPCVWGTVFAENFDNATPPAVPAGWDSLGSMDSTTTWTTVTAGTYPPDVAPHSGSNMARFDSGEGVGNAALAYYPTFNTTGFTNLRFSFWVFHDAEKPLARDRVYLTTKKSDTGFSQTGPAIYRQTEGLSGWVSHTVSLADFINDTEFQFRLTGWGDGGNDVYVDDILLSRPFPSGDAYRGTVGTIITLDAGGADFGTSGKVGLQYTAQDKPVAIKASSWTPGEIICTLAKGVAPGTYDVLVLPKNGDLFTLSDSFEVCEPHFEAVEPSSGAPGDLMTIDGLYFGSKRPKVYFIGTVVPRAKSAKVVSFSFNPYTNWGRLTVAVPKILGGAYDVKVVNDVGECSLSSAFTVIGPAGR